MWVPELCVYGLDIGLVHVEELPMLHGAVLAYEGSIADIRVS